VRVPAPGERALTVAVKVTDWRRRLIGGGGHVVVVSARLLVHDD